ncbi:LPS export ABC transporter permease LptF [Breoghania sp.]|uniref:LPS export ABC transporter permease LptF n=1 Tax=Breoghania sp. TaxID=2065378 RepID=UPI0026036DE8|nr:LPS export ABC transporter permease LptF [Breoghania sp.]MDJ0930829.1 LPS export ABC transporter permease LptF [Breoghania sp.]
MIKTIERYILRRITGAFLLAFGAMIGVVWATQALRQLDLVTAKGQTIVQFLKMTMLALPFLGVIVAPFVFAIALIIVLNALNSDNELVVINATGAAKIKVFKPVMAFAVVLSVLTLVASLWVSPLGLAQLREELTQVRIDLVANIVRPGRFIEVDDGLTFHIRNRSGDGTLESLMMDDRRDLETTFTYLAQRGQVAEIGDRMLLVMHDGTIQRRTNATGAISIVKFESYAFDLTSLMPQASAPTFKPSERTIGELLNPPAGDEYYKRYADRFRAEIHDRFAVPLYPLAFGLIVFVFLGQARTTRQSRHTGVLGALFGCVFARVAGFGATNMAVSDPDLIFVVYALPLAIIAIAGRLSLADKTPVWIRIIGHAMHVIVGAVETSAERLTARFANGRT